MILSRQCKCILGIKVCLLWIVGGILFSRYMYTGGIVITILAFIIYFGLTMKERLIFIVCSLPMAAIFKIAPNRPSSIVILYVLFILEYYYNKKTMNLKVLCSLVLFGICQICTMFLYNSGLMSILAFIVNILFCTTAFEYLYGKENHDELFKQCSIMFSLVMVINIIMAEKYPNIAFVISYEKQNALEHAGRFAALNSDPNYYNQLVAVALCLLLAIIFNKSVNAFQKIFLSAVFAFLAVKGLKSGSKSYVVVLLVLLFFLMVLLIRNSAKNKSFVFKILIISIAGAYIAVLLTNDVLIPLFLERAKDNTSLLSNRDIIWRNYIQNFISKPMVWFIGAGIMNAGNVLAKGSAAHNVYIELLVETGLVGIFVLRNVLGNVLGKFRELLKNMDLLFVWALLITSLGLSLSSNDAMFVLLPLAALEGGKERDVKDIKKN